MNETNVEVEAGKGIAHYELNKLFPSRKKSKIKYPGGISAIFKTLIRNDKGS